MLWDMGKPQNFRECKPGYFYRNTDGVLFVFSVEDSYTFQNLQEWNEELVYRIDNLDSLERALIGNKCDLPCEIEEEQVKALSKELQVKQLHFVSAKTGENVMKTFNDLIAVIHHRRTKVPEGSNTDTPVTDIEKSSKCICC